VKEGQTDLSTATNGIVMSSMDVFPPLERSILGGHFVVLSKQPFHMSPVLALGEFVTQEYIVCSFAESVEDVFCNHSFLPRFFHCRMINR
jgi:hypothetical protein